MTYPYSEIPRRGNKIIKLNLKKRSYDIIVGRHILSRLPAFIKTLKVGRDAYIITNPLIAKKCAGELKRALKKSGLDFKIKTVADSETSKSLKTAGTIIEDILEWDKKKQIFIIALGGGVVGDLSGFVASIYKRGTPYIQIPTTLLAQVDSSIGGKTAVDLAQGKNLVGTFYQPRLVLSDVEILKSLRLREVRSGLAEVIKYGVIKDPYLFSYLENKYKEILKLKSSALEFIVERSSLIKVKIVQQDEREEKGIRTILNFGHTIGHSLETASGYQAYTHGEAIALGMLVACDISQRIRILNNRAANRIEKLIRDIGLPDQIRAVSLKNIIKAHHYDKKFKGAKNKFVLIEDIGKTRIVENIPQKVIKEALAARLKQ